MGAYEYFVPVYATSISLTVPGTAKHGKTVKVSGAMTPTTAPGKVTVTLTRLKGKTWVGAGSMSATIGTGGKFTCTFVPGTAGGWRVVAGYAGKVGGPTTYKPSKSSTKWVSVK